MTRHTGSESSKDSSEYEIYKFLEEIFESSIEEPDFTDLIKNLSDLYDSFSGQGFEKSFKLHMMYIVSESKRSPDVRRILRFISECVITMDNKFKNSQPKPEEENDEEVVHPLLEYLFKLLDKWSRASCYTVRFRSCQLLNMILTHIQDYGVGEIDMATYEMIAKIVEERRLDVSCNVRAHTVLLAKFFQDPSTVNDPVIAGLCWQMQHDPNSRVRQNILTILAACEETVMPIAKRFLFDKNPSVRNAALLHICNRISPRSFSVSQRVLILQQCFSDSSDLVRRNAEQKLIPVWLRAYGDDLCKFLKDIRGSNDSLANLVFIRPLLNVLSKCIKISQVLEEVGLDPVGHLPKEDTELTGEKVFLWQHFYGIALHEERLLQFIPQPSTVIDYIIKYLQKFSFENEKIIPCIEFSVFLTELFDQNQNISNISEIFTHILDLIKSPFLPNETIPYLVTLYLRHSPKGKQYIHDDFLEVIEDFQKVLQFTDGEEKNIILRCFIITSELLNDETELTNSIKNIKDKLITPNLTSEDTELKLQAVRTLAMYCLLDIHEARSCWSFFENSIHTEPGELKIILLKGLFDILRCHGPKLFSDVMNSGEDIFDKTVDNILTNLEVEEEESDIVVRGILKLFLDHHTWSPDLLYKIVLLYFNPEPFYTAKKDLENFFKVYCQTKDEAGCVNKTFLCITNYLFDAKKNSPYHKISIKKTVLKLIEFSKLYESSAKFLLEEKFQDLVILALTEKFLKKPFRLPPMDLHSICNQNIPKNLEILMALKENIKAIIENISSTAFSQKNPFSKRCINNFSVYLKKIQLSIDKSPLEASRQSVQKRLFVDSVDSDSPSTSERNVDIQVDSSPTNNGSPRLDPPEDEIVEPEDFEDAEIISPVARISFHSDAELTG